MKRIVFIFAHPDDEFGCFESIRLATEARQRVQCYYLTDGGYGGQSTMVRKKESLRVLWRLGVDAENVFFVGVERAIPDGRLYESDNMMRAAGAVYAAVGKSQSVDAIYAPAWEGGHQDHDAAHVIACLLADKLPSRPRVLQYSLYNGCYLKGGFFRVMAPLDSNGPTLDLPIRLHLKLKYLMFCLSYHSQWKTWLGLFPFVFIKLSFGGKYHLQLAAPPRAFGRPHSGALLYERRRTARFEDVSAGVSRFVRSWHCDVVNR